MRTTPILACFLVLFSSACATRYQDLLRDRDGEIRDLQGQLSDLRSANSELERRISSERTAAPEVDVRPAAVTSSSAELARVQDELPGLDVRYKAGRLSIGIENTVTFDSGSVSLKPTSHAILKKVAGVLRSSYGNRRIYVEGHTDSDPIKKTADKFRSNRHLSVERADAVARFLVGQCGVPESSVVVVGYGHYDPRDSGSGNASKARNRRVEIVVGEQL
jgi:chemotaxis protein MotB